MHICQVLGFICRIDSNQRGKLLKKLLVFSLIDYLLGPTDPLRVKDGFENWLNLLWSVHCMRLIRFFIPGFGNAVQNLPKNPNIGSI